MTETYSPKKQTLSETEKRIKGFQSWIEVDLDAIGYNLEQVKLRTGGEIIPCVKSNAYGHGLIPTVSYMIKQGIKRVLVAKLYEAEQMRDIGLNCDIICLDPLFTAEQYETVVKKRITQTVFQRDSVQQLSAAAQLLRRGTPVWVKIDTGLGRVGVNWRDAVEFIDFVSKSPFIDITGIFSTLSEDTNLDKLQVERMQRICEELKNKKIGYGVASIASSNAIFHKPYSFFEATRPGLMLFGFYPDPEDRATGITLKQSFSLKARIEQVKWVESGESLTYSRRFTTVKRTKVGTIHVGYSDGYPRGLTNKGQVKIDGKTCPVIGTVSVNHILVDITGTDADVGDIVELISREGENNAHKVAEVAGIMVYSLMVGLNPLTPRVYYSCEKPVTLSEYRLVAI